MGVQRHLPGAVGIILKGFAICAVAATGHLVADIDLATTAVGTSVGVGVGSAARLWLTDRE